MTTKLAIFTSHPIQYQAPWFRHLHQQMELSVRVYFGFTPDSKEQGIGFGQSFTWDLPLLDGYENETLKSFELPTYFPGFSRRIARRIRPSLDEFQPDVALVWGWQKLMLVQALFHCRSRGIPVIMRGESNAKKDRSSITRWLHRTYLKNVDVFLSTGDSNRQFYLDSGAADDSIFSAKLFVENSRFARSAKRLKSQREEIRAKWGVPPDAFCVLFAGKLEEKKRVRDVIAAIKLAHAKDNRVHGLIVGSGEQMAIARELSRDAPISFTGFLNQTKMPMAYVAADTIVLPSNYGEVWGLVVNEAMASGVPAIVSERVGCADDLVLHNQTGFVTEYAQPKDIMKSILAMSQDQAKHRELSESAFNHVSQRFSIESAQEGTMRAIRTARERKS